jgi:hypothetical protein
LLGFFAAAIFLHETYPRYLWLFVGMAFVLPNVVRGELGARDDDHDVLARDAPNIIPIQFKRAEHDNL